MIVLATIVVIAISVYLIKDDDNCCDKGECWKCPFPCAQHDKTN